jgi:hypothetical protein
VAVWREVNSGDTPFLRLADRLVEVLQPGAVLPPVDQLEEFAAALDDLNKRLQHRADKTIASLHAS